MCIICINIYGSAGPDPEWGPRGPGIPPRGEASDRIQGGARGARASHQEVRLRTGSRVGPEGPGHLTKREGFGPDPGWGPRGPAIPPRGEAPDRIQGGARGARASHQEGRLRTGSRVGPEGPGHPTKRGGLGPDPEWGPRGPGIPPGGEASDRIQGGARGARASHQEGRLRTGSRVGPEGSAIPPRGEAPDRIQGGARGARTSHQEVRLRTGSRVGPEGPGHPTKR